MKNIIITGFMGTGKTAVSRELAKRLDLKYVSTDILIEKLEEKAIKDIFTEKGEKYFRKVEKSVIKDISGKENQVIDTGGGAVIDADNINLLKKSGMVICLTADPDIILIRTRNSSMRPLLNVDDPKKKIMDLLKAREEFYKKADFAISTSNKTVTEVADCVIELAQINLPKIKHATEVRIWEFLLTKFFYEAESPIIVTDMSGAPIFINLKCEELFPIKIEANNNTGSWIDMVAPADGSGKSKEKLNKVLKSKMSCEFQIEVNSKDGKNIYYRWLASPLRSGDGSYMMFIGREISTQSLDDIVPLPSTNREIVDIIFSGFKRSEPETAFHSLRVMGLARKFGARLNLTEDRIHLLKLAALFHDIGKLLIDEKVLFKPGKLNDMEFEEMKKHPSLSAAIIKPVIFLEKVLPVVGSHHENFDGSGYPKGLKGEAIPLEARAVGIIDIYGALTSDRPYRKALSEKEAVEIIKSFKGWKLDPELTDIFLDMLENKEFEGL